MKTDKLLQLIQQKRVMRSGGALPLPKAQNGKQKLPQGFMSYESNPDYFDSHAVLHDNPQYNEQVKKMVYAGKAAFNPTTGELRFINGTPASAETQQMASRNYGEMNELERTAATRKARMDEADRMNQQIADQGYSDDWRKELATSTQSTGDRFRLSLKPNLFDDYFNPGVWFGSMASGLGQAPYQAQQTDSYMPYVTSIGTPLTLGAFTKVMQGVKNPFSLKYPGLRINPENKITGGLGAKGLINKEARESRLADIQKTKDVVNNTREPKFYKYDSEDFNKSLFDSHFGSENAGFNLENNSGDFYAPFDNYLIAKETYPLIEEEMLQRGLLGQSIKKQFGFPISEAADFHLIDPRSPYRNIFNTYDPFSRFGLYNVDDNMLNIMKATMYNPLQKKPLWQESLNKPHLMNKMGGENLPKHQARFSQVGKPQPIVTLQRDQPVTRMIKDPIIGFANDPNVVKYNQTLKDPVWSDAYQFLMNWYSNPVTKERLRKQGAPLNPMVEALNQKRFDDAFDWYLDQREKNSKIAESVYSRHDDFNDYVRFKEDLNKIAEHNYEKNRDETAGFHIPADSSITITDSSRDKELNDQTAVHEITHATPLDNFYKNYFKNFKPTKANQKELDYFNSNLDEIYPRIMDLRFQMNRDGILAPGMKVTPDMIEPYYNYSDDDIRNYYTLEELAKIMNEVAYNASAQESNQARQGGSLPIAQNGLPSKWMRTGNTGFVNLKGSTLDEKADAERKIKQKEEFVKKQQEEDQKQYGVDAWRTGKTIEQLKDEENEKWNNYYKLQNRVWELEEDPSKWNINDWKNYGIKEGDASAEGFSNPLNWPGLALAGLGAWEVGAPVLGAVNSALSVPVSTVATFGNSAALPWLTGNTVLGAYGASLIPGNLERGEYGWAALNSSPVTAPLLGAGFRGAKNLYNTVAGESGLFSNFKGARNLFNTGKNFKSEINWGKWNSEIPSNKALMDEYHAIEETSKANGTWMKNADGSAFQGTPEQFVQQQSSNFKKAFPNGFEVTYRGSSTDNPLLIEDPSRNFKSVFSGDYATAEEYVNTTKFHSGKSKNALRNFLYPTDGIYELGIPKQARTLSFDAGSREWFDLTNKDVLHQLKNNSAVGIRPYSSRFTTKEVAKLIDNSSELDRAEIFNIIDTPSWSNMFSTTKNNIPGKIIINKHIPGNYAKSLRGNNGMFDMTNPNIYKGLIPAGIFGAGMYASEPLQQQRNGGSLDKYQWKYGQVSPRDSVQNIAYNTMTWEKNRGHESGYGLSDFGNPKLPTGATINDAVNWYMNNTYTNPIISEFPTAKEKGAAGDFIYNAGRDPRIYMLDQYLKSIGQTGLPGRGGFNIDMNKNPNDWAKKKPELDALWNKYKSQIYKLSENDRRILLNKGRDFYYQNINTNADGTPSDAYWNTWYGRQHATDQYVPFTDADVTNTSNKKFYPIKKQVGGSLPQAQFGGFPLGGLSSVLMSYLMNNTSNTPANNENPTNENLSDDIQRNAYYNWLKTQENNKNDIRGGWNSKLKLWMPYKSAEGGLPTIGYGHKLTPEDVKTKRFVKGITDEEAFDLMKNDFTSHYNLANKLYDKRFKNRNLTFNQLPYNQRLLIGDYSYNVGPQFFEEDTKKYPKAFPKFLNAIVDYNQAKSDKDRERYRNIIKKEYVRYFNKNTPMRERNKGTINLFLKDFGITPDMVDRSTYEKEEGGQLLPKHQLIGSVSSQLINQALGQTNPANVRSTVTVAPKNVAAQSVAKDIATYGSIEKAEQAKAIKKSQAAQKQSVISAPKPGYGNYEYYNPAQGEFRDDTKLAPEGSTRATFQNALNTANEFFEYGAKGVPNGNIAKLGYDMFVGAPAQSAINLSNTAMGDRPIRGDKDFANFGWDIANVLPFVGDATSGAKKAITAFDDAGKMAFGATPQMGIFPKSFGDLFGKTKVATSTGFEIKPPRLVKFEEFFPKPFEYFPKKLQELRTRGANWDKIASEQGKTFNATNILHPEAIHYHGTFDGRPIVQVRMPDGTSEYFYKSTSEGKKFVTMPDGSKKSTLGMWQVYPGEHINSPGHNAWFIKDEGFEDFYGSKFFGDMANSMDDALLRKFNLNNVDELDNAVNFRKINGKIDTFTPKEKEGGSLPKAQTGIPYDKIAQTAVKYSNPRKFIDIQPVYHQNIVIDNYSPKVNYLLQGDKLYMAPKGTDAWLDISDNNFAKKGVYNFLNETGQLKNYSQEERDIYNLLQNNQYDYFGRFNAKPAAPATAVVAPIAPADTTSVFGNTPWGTTGKVSNPVISKVIDPNNYRTTPLVKAAPTKTVVPVKKESMKDLILKELTSANDYAAKLYDDFTDALQDKVMGVASNIDSNVDEIKYSRIGKEIRAIPGYFERAMMKDDIPVIGSIPLNIDVTKTQVIKSKPTDIKATAAAIDSKSPYPKRKNYTIEPLYKELSTTNDGYLSYINVFDNNKGFDYVPTARLDKAGKYSNVEGMAHFLFDYDMTTGQSADNSNTLFMHNNAKYINPKSIGSNEPLPSIPMRDLQEGKAFVRKLLTYGSKEKELDPKSLKDVKADNPGSTVVDPYYTIWKRNPNGTVNVKYKKADEITKGDKLGDSLRQYRFTDINWDSQTQARNFKESIGALRVKNSDVPSYFIYPKAKERGQKDAYGKFGGNSVIFLIEDTNVAIDFSGSINQIKDQGLRIIQQFGIKPEQLVIAYHDVGSYSAKPQDINGVIDSDRYYDFNTNKQTGAGLAIPKIRK